jgi:arabinofuranan 3-O-arabinosyltransferase
MTIHEAVRSGAVWDIRTSRSVELIGFGLCAASAVYLLASFMQGSYLLDREGHGVPADFVSVWAAGRLVLDGHPEAAYNWTTILKSVEETALGTRFEGYYAWLYPPPFLFVAALLATLPFAIAQACWSILTFPAYVITVRAIVGDRIGTLLACAFPAILSNFMVGQNGSLSAALLGGSLFFMERRPVLAGCFLGLLTYKPQLGLLFPVVLIASGRWRAFWTAAGVGSLLILMSWAAFGTSAWIGFIHSMPIAAQAFLVEGQADWSKLQTLFGIVRSLGGSDTLAWWLQGLLIGAITMLLCGLWRSSVSFDMKAAALASGALFSTPYLYMYDFVTLAVPMAFLVRAGMAEGFLRGEMIGLAGASLLILVSPFVQAPIGPLALLIVALLIGRRTFLQLQSNPIMRRFLVRCGAAQPHAERSGRSGTC